MTAAFRRRRVRLLNRLRFAAVVALLLALAPFAALVRLATTHQGESP